MKVVQGTTTNNGRASVSKRRQSLLKGSLAYLQSLRLWRWRSRSLSVRTSQSSRRSSSVLCCNSICQTKNQKNKKNRDFRLNNVYYETYIRRSCKVTTQKSRIPARKSRQKHKTKGQSYVPGS